MRDYNHYMVGNDSRSAYQMLNEILSQDPTHAEANYLMGNLLGRESEYTEANQYFERSVNSSSLYKEHIDYLKERNYRMEFNEGVSALEEERWDRVIQKISYARDIFPDRIEVYYLLGKGYGEINEPAEEQRVYTTCLSYSETNNRCGVNLSDSYYNQGKYSQAIETIKLMLQTYPNDTNLLKLLAYSQFGLRDFNTSSETFDEYINLKNSYEALKQYAIELNNVGEIVKAESYFRRCLERVPRDREVLSALSSIYLELGNYRLLVQANERLLSMDPDNESLKMRLMTSYELFGDIDNYRALKLKMDLD